MTQEDKEKVKEIAHKNNILGKYMMDEIEKCCLEMAAWKQEKLIKNMVEWLSLNADLYGCFKPDKLNEMVLNCKKAMEE